MEREAKSTVGRAARKSPRSLASLAFFVATWAPSAPHASLCSCRIQYIFELMVLFFLHGERRLGGDNSSSGRRRLFTNSSRSNLKLNFFFNFFFFASLLFRRRL